MTYQAHTLFLFGESKDYFVPEEPKPPPRLPSIVVMSSTGIRFIVAYLDITVWALWSPWRR